MQLCAGYHLNVIKSQLSIKSNPVVGATQKLRRITCREIDRTETEMMTLKQLTIATLFSAIAHTAEANTDLEKSLATGGEMLNADQIAALIVGKVVEANSGEKAFRFYYDPSNTLTGELTNGGWKGAGAYAITDTNQVCVSMAADKGRYRCLTVVRDGDRVQKFNAAGKMTFDLISFTSGEGL